MEDKIYISNNGLQALKKRYNEIDKEISDTLKLMGESAKMDNDLRENPDFMAHRVKAMYDLPNEKEHLKDVIAKSIVIENMHEYINFDGSKVILGSKITVNFDGEKETYIILGTDEGIIQNNEIACNAPLAKALLGRNINETITFNGCDITILEIEKV